MKGGQLSREVFNRVESLAKHACKGADLKCRVVSSNYKHQFLTIRIENDKCTQHTYRLLCVSDLKVANKHLYNDVVGDAVRDLVSRAGESFSVPSAEMKHTKRDDVMPTVTEIDKTGDQGATVTPIGAGSNQDKPRTPDEFERQTADDGYLVTDKNFQYFSSRVQHWSRIYGLQRWEIHTHKGGTHNLEAMGATGYDVAAMRADIYLALKFDNLTEPTDSLFDHIAHHEILEILLAPLREFCCSNSLSRHVKEANHSIIQTLVNKHEAENQTSP